MVLHDEQTKIQLKTEQRNLRLSELPDFDKDFVNEEDIKAFENALKAPDTNEDEFITALNDWKPVRQKIRRKPKKRPRRGKDETREGVVYQILKWPLLIASMTWILALSMLYLFTRVYISQYEYWVTWRGKRENLRKTLQHAGTYEEWVEAAKELDSYLGAEEWKENDEFAYYDYVTVRKVVKDMKRLRTTIQSEIDAHKDPKANGNYSRHNMNTVTEELRMLLEACVKANFGGVENARLYSQTYYGTKNLIQEYFEEVCQCLRLIIDTDLLPLEEKRAFFRHAHYNYGRTALCLSGGASFAYYHFGVARALVDADLLPQVITGTSGGSIIASLICTRTDEELKKLLVPELAYKITACHEPFHAWIRRWWRTGARFDSVDWARRCNWFTRGSTTFREALERTGRILNISCIPSDPHSPSLLLNHITAPDCVIWSTCLASSAVPGILNPVVLMMKTKSEQLVPFSFGHKWKDGSLRTDIPLRALNMHFNVNFSIVSQVNPHVNIFFFSSRGTVGRPVTHRKGKGWRGGFLGSAVEQYLKLDLAKWLKVLRHLELLPRPMSQDWSSLWLQKFDGNITIWPKSKANDFWYILSDPTLERLERMIRAGQQATWPKLLFMRNRLRVERLIEEGRYKTRLKGDINKAFSIEDAQGLRQRKLRAERIAKPLPAPLPETKKKNDNVSPSLSRRFSWFGNWGGGGGEAKDIDMAPITDGVGVRVVHSTRQEPERKFSNGSVTGKLEELGRQGRVFIDDDSVEEYSCSESDSDRGSAIFDGDEEKLYADAREEGEVVGVIEKADGEAVQATGEARGAQRPRQAEHVESGGGALL